MMLKFIAWLTFLVAVIAATVNAIAVLVTTGWEQAFAVLLTLLMVHMILKYYDILRGRRSL